jgi:hypothetical protein
LKPAIYPSLSCQQLKAPEEGRAGMRKKIKKILDIKILLYSNILTIEYICFER